MEIALLVVILIGVAAGIYLMARGRREPSQENSQALLLLQNQINELTRTLNAKLGESTRAFQQQFGESAKIIRDVTEKLTRLDETNKQVLSFSEQIRSLQDILKNPKQRGVLGEYYLESVLKNVLPPNGYQMQYPFADGTIVDAVVFSKEGAIPVDSKFSLENYNRLLDAKTEEERSRFESAFVQDLKNRIDETSKYVKPGEGTLNFAFMFIPSEAVYYDLLINKVGTVKSSTANLVEYAWKKGVIIVSPTTFLAYLQTVLQGLRALKIEESAKEIRKRVEELGRHLKTYDEYFKKVGGHLQTTVNTYNRASKEFVKIDKDVLRISGESPELEPLSIEGPNEEE